MAMSFSNAYGESVLAISEQSGVWRVSLNGQFYGHYISEEWAMEAALQKAHSIGGGKMVRVVILRPEATASVLLFDSARESMADE
jgi:hypothetical protein